MAISLILVFISLETAYSVQSPDIILFILGTWFIILQFVNFCGVVSNGFLIGFTSSWGRSQDKYTQLWIVLGFEVRVLHHRHKREESQTR